jgi:hypothetical protein
MNRRERPPKLSRHTKDTARPAIGLFSDYIREGARIAQRKEKGESRRKTSYEENPGYPFSEKLPNIIPASAVRLCYNIAHLSFTTTTYTLCTYRRPRGISTTSRHISFEFLFIKTFPRP